MTTTAPIAAARRGRPATPSTRAAAVRIGVVPPLGVASGSSCFSSSSAFCQRSAGAFARHFITTRESAAGTSGRCFSTGSGSAVRWAASISCAVVAAKGPRPVSSSYPSTPSA
jgi:hypothetical protein